AATVAARPPGRGADKTGGTRAKRHARPPHLPGVSASRRGGSGTAPAMNPSADGKRPAAASIIRRNLQREHVKDLSSLVLGRRTGGGGLSFFGDEIRVCCSGSSDPPDARPLPQSHPARICPQDRGHAHA